MEDKLQALKQLIYEVYDLNFAQALLGWDQQVYMPTGGAEERGEQLATLARLSHIKMTSPEIGKLLDDLAPYASQLDPDSDDARLIKVTRREYEKRTKVTPEWVARFAQETVVAESAWEHARADSNFALFRPNLERIVDLRRQYAEFFTPYKHVYDPLLDDFEPGMKTAEVKEIFDVLRPQQVSLIQAVKSRPQVDDSFSQRTFAEKPAWDFGVEVISAFGYDWKRGRQDKSAHPFTTTIGLNDVRITTRFVKDLGTSSLFSTMHEGGHALYEQGVSPALRRTPLASGASMAIHESQSRMWENLVGRSLPFWKHFYPRYQQLFPAELGNVDLMTFYKGINKVEPSLIRVEADEATYNLHIMLRLELEIAMMEGKLAVKDLPDAWNSRMKEYLGITPPDDAHGVLQDIHWSGGSIGYFPTYALGNLVSAQLWERIQKDMPDLEAQIEKGEFGNLLTWLRNHIHRHGAKFEPQELMLKVTGSKIDPQPYIRYLKSKFGAIYNI
jgi:carboxypeptidase Taq